MRKRICLLIVALTLIGCLLASCTPPATPTPTPVPTPEPTPEPSSYLGELTPAEELSVLPGDNLGNFFDAEPISYTQKSKKTDYMYMYFRDGIDGVSVRASSRNLIVKSGRYGFEYNAQKNDFVSFGLCNNTASQDALGSATRAADAFPSASMSFGLYKDGVEHQVNYGGGFGNFKLIRSGSTLQSFYIGNMYSLSLSGPDFRTEINASPNMFSICYDMFLLKSDELSEITGLTFRLDFAVNDKELTVAKWLNDDPASGVVTLSSADRTRNVTFVSPIREKDGTRDKLELIQGEEGVVLRVTTDGTVTLKGSTKRQQRTNAVGLIVLPGTADPRAAAYLIEDSLAADDFLRFTGIAPYTKKCTVEFDSMRGIYAVTLRPVGSRDENVQERVKLELANKYGYDIDALIMLTHKRGAAVSAVGSVPMIRELDGTPTGLSVQISKNWHSLPDEVYLDGQWQEYYALLHLPARKAVKYEFTCAMEKWGRAYSVSHAQLCLIGWSPNAALLWEQAAFGNYTENICYAPGGDCMGQDVRGFYFTTKGTALNGFANNVGGTDFLIYYDANGRRVQLKEMLIRYLDYGPNLTRVTYDGVTADRAIRFHFESYLLRGDDFCRIWHKFDYTFLTDVSDAKNISLYQFGAEYYNEGYHDTFAYGSASGGLVKEFTHDELQMGGSNTALNYIPNGKYLPLEGEDPWLAWLGTTSTLSADSGFGHANKGLVVRDYHAVIGGQESVTPYLSIRPSNGHHTATPSNIMEINAGTNVFKAGDEIHGTVEIFVLPQSRQQYIGKSSDYYVNLLTQYAGSWQLVNRFAADGHSVPADVTGATVAGTYPTVLRLDDGAQRVSFRLTNGDGYVPVKFTNVPTHTGWKLKLVNADGSMTDIADSQAAYGNDFWQCRYDAETDSYELTYNIPIYETGASFVLEHN